MANYHEEDRPVRDEGVAPVPREAPYYRGQADQGRLADRKASLLNTGTIGHVPGNPYSRRLPSMYVQDAPNASRRALPRDTEVYRIDAPSGGSFVRHLDGHTTHEFDRPGLVEYLHSLDPNDPEDADEHASVKAEIANRDFIHGHPHW